MLHTAILDSSNIENARPGIGSLFHKCFGKELAADTWEWAYKKNPSGDPVVAIALSGSEIVGHYAMIPMPFHFENSTLIGYLSMTTMVHPDFRKDGLFASLAKMVYEAASYRTFVYGFPNTNSLPGFAKRLDWQINKNFFVIKVANKDKKSKLINPYQHSLSKIGLNTEDHDFINWRLSKPGISYKFDKQKIWKNHGSEVDLLHVKKSIDNIKLPGVHNVNFLSNNLVIYEPVREFFNYPFGIRSLGADISLEDFKPSLLMSDVF